jgi:hypothetical protein
VHEGFGGDCFAVLLIISMRYGGYYFIRELLTPGGP